MSGSQSPGELGQSPNPRSLALFDSCYFIAFGVIAGLYVLLILSMLAANLVFVLDRSLSAEGQLIENPILKALRDEHIQYSIQLSLISCTLSALLSVLVAVPTGYLMSRYRFWGQQFVDSVLDIPIVLPPLVVGLSLLILFQFPPFSWYAREIVFQVPAVVIAQFSVACAFSVRAMKATFDHIDPRCEQVALTLGCNRFEAFGWVVLPEAARGILTAFTLAWARSLGEFGPLLIFAGATRGKTEVLSTSVFLEINVGNVEGAVAVSLIMVAAAVIVLMLARIAGSHELIG